MKFFLSLVFLLLFSQNQYAQNWLITQEDWGGIDSVDSSLEHEISYITIHHGGEIFPDDKNTVTYLQGLQKWSRSDRKWNDIPYHYIVARDGKIYEGRPLNYKGDTNTTYDPTGHALIVLLGNFEEQEVNAEQVSSLKTVTAYLAKQESVPAEKIKTHKDYAETLCPGKKLSGYLNSRDWDSFLKNFN
ncbi:MAG: peptidoglycan recognition family protein [Balneola sp.]